MSFDGKKKEREYFYILASRRMRVKLFSIIALVVIGFCISFYFVQTTNRQTNNKNSGNLARNENYDNLGVLKMSLNEFDKDILFQEIKQIQNTLEASYVLPNLETSNEIVEVEEQEESDEEPLKSIQSSSFNSKSFNLMLFLHQILLF